MRVLRTSVLRTSHLWPLAVACPQLHGCLLGGDKCTMAEKVQFNSERFFFFTTSPHHVVDRIWISRTVIK